MKCRAPGCETVLDRRNITGLCARHGHFPGLCPCASCGGTKVERAPYVPPVPTRVYLAPKSFEAAGVTYEKIRLPKEPWL
jgi:hypothetical protein